MASGNGASGRPRPAGGSGRKRKSAIADRDATLESIVETTSVELLARLARTPLRAEPIREVRREFSKRIAAWTPDQVVQLALSLVRESGSACRLVAYELLSENRGAMSRLNSRMVELLGAGLDDWAVVDMFGVYVSGPAWREGLISDRTVHKWMSSG